MQLRKAWIPLIFLFVTASLFVLHNYQIASLATPRWDHILQNITSYYANPAGPPIHSKLLEKIKKAEESNLNRDDTAPLPVPTGSITRGWEQGESVDRRKVFATLFVGQKPVGAIALMTLVWSLRWVGSRAPFVAMHLAPFSEIAEDLGAENLQWLYSMDVTFVHITDAEDDFPKEMLAQIGAYAWRVAFNKVKAWKLIQYRRIVIIDLDGLVLRNIDFLLHFPQHATSNDQSADYGRSFQNINTGVFVIQPAEKIYSDMVEWVKKLDPAGSTLRVSEQSLMIGLYGHNRINVMPNTIGMAPPAAAYQLINHMIEWDDIFYLHYYSAHVHVPKPWQVQSQTYNEDSQVPGSSYQVNITYSLWFQAYERMRRRDLRPVPLSYTPWTGPVAVPAQE